MFVRRDDSKRDQQPGAHRVRDPKVVLYTRRGCHLCDDALAVLEAHRLVPTCVDVDAALRAQFGQCVPVVEIDGQIRFRGRVEPVLLRRLLGSER